jgi:hypothetical protein
MFKLLRIGKLARAIRMITMTTMMLSLQCPGSESVGRAEKITRQKHTSIDINSMGIETTYGGIPGMITKHGQIWVQFNLPKTPMFSCQRWPVCFADSFIPRYSHSGICQFLDTKET